MSKNITKNKLASGKMPHRVVLNPVTVNEEGSDKIANWCRENIGQEYQDWSHDTLYTWRFTRVESSSFFILRWL